MRAAVATSQNHDAPLTGLLVTEVAEPIVPDGWARVRIVSASLNPHDVWTLRGVGHPAERIPMTLGCDGAGYTDDGKPVIIYPVIASESRGLGDMTMDPQRSIISELYNGTFAEYIVVPESCLVPKPEWLSFDEAAAMGITWGTAYRMLFTRAGLQAGDRVLVQGASGGVASAAISLAKAAGATVYVTARDERKRQFALELGADAVFEPGARLPERVDIVVESVGEATWSHSLKSLRPGGTVVVCGATSGPNANADLNRVFYQQLSIIGSTTCTLSEFYSCLRVMEESEARPIIDHGVSLDNIHQGFESLINGDNLGKIVVHVSEEK
jgi:NADPH:quinone reductase-like Zn-dependent oxidoreductase